MVSHVDDYARQEFRERLRDANPVEEVIQDYVPLLPDGAHRFKAKCPFHREKSPSFKVDTVRGSYHCFGCGERGDVFSFVMKMENLEFREALDRLADRAGIPRPERAAGGRSFGGGSSRRSADRKQAIDLLQRASRWFRSQLLGTDGEKARAYLAERGFSRESCEHFEVGYAPAGWDRLRTALDEWQVSPELSCEVGLLRERASGGGHYDAYRDRLIFPIRALNGNVVGFGGRVLQAKEGEPKYINSPESSVFQKGKLLYGHYEGREPIRRDRKILLMEGYTDVMMAHQSGFTEAVATLGTALTEANVGVIARFAEKIWLVFDGDRAGREAALKAIRLGLSEPVEIRVLLLPEGEDPCEALLGPGGQDLFRERLESAPEALRFAREEFARTFGAASGREKQQVAFAYFELLAQLESEIRRRQGLEELSSTLEVATTVLEDEYRRWSAQQRRRPGAGAQSSSGSETNARSIASVPEGVSHGQHESQGQRVGRQVGGASPVGGALQGARLQPRVEEEAILLAMIGRPDRVELLHELYPPERYKDLVLGDLARALHRASGDLDVVALETPDLKSAWLELEDKVAVGALSEEQSCLLLSGLIRRRVERECEAITSKFRRGSDAFGDEGRRRHDELAICLSQLRSLRVRLQDSRRGDWELLSAEARLGLKLSAETGSASEPDTVEFTQPDSDFRPISYEE